LDWHTPHVQQTRVVALGHKRQVFVDLALQGVSTQVLQLVLLEQKLVELHHGTQRALNNYGDFGLQSLLQLSVVLVVLLVVFRLVIDNVRITVLRIDVPVAALVVVEPCVACAQVRNAMHNVAYELADLFHLIYFV